MEKGDLWPRGPLRAVEVGSAENPVVVGGAEITLWCGPCAVESRRQIMETGAFLSRHGVRILRGGAFKPRTSPYSFQGLGEPALRWLSEASRRYGMASVTEVLDTRDVPLTAEYADILQVGTRNMQNYALLKMLGRQRKPVLLKRGMGSTLREFLFAAEYILSEGNENVILCERGSRTFEPSTRATLDLSIAVLARRLAGLPVIVDVSHALGRTDIMAPVARAALAAGVDGVMCEVHPAPETALSDGGQSLDFSGFADLLGAIRPFLAFVEGERKAGALEPAASNDQILAE